MLWESVAVFAQAILVSLIPLLPVSAVLDPEDPPPADVPAPPPTSAIYVTLGFGAPLGGAGIELVHQLGSILEIAGGLGIGLGASNAQPSFGYGEVFQWAVMPRLRLGDSRGVFTIGAGVSGGNYAAIPPCTCSLIDGGQQYIPPSPRPVSYFLWGNIEIGGEWWATSGFALRVFGGFASGWCVGTRCVSDPTGFPYLGFGVGYAL